MDGNILFSGAQLLRAMVGENEVEGLARVDGICDDVRVFSHPHLHGQLVDKLLCDGIFPDRVVRHQGTVGAVGSRRLRCHIGEQSLSCDTVDTICADDKVELVLSLVPRLNRNFLGFLIIDVGDSGVDEDLSTQLLGDFDKTFMKMGAVNNPPRPTQRLFQGGNLGVADQCSVFAAHVELLKLHQVLANHLVHAPSLKEDRDIWCHLDAGTDLKMVSGCIFQRIQGVGYLGMLTSPSCSADSRTVTCAPVLWMAMAAARPPMPAPTMPTRSF